MGKDEDKRTVEQVKRDDFLSIVKSDGSGKQFDDSDMPNIERDGVKFKNEFELKTAQAPTKKPLITEIAPSDESAAERTRKEAEAKKIAEVEVKFDWETATRVELKPQYIAQSDFIFLNLPLKGYKKDEDIRYALSENELSLEVRDRSAPNKVRRLCQTLNK